MKIINAINEKTLEQSLAERTIVTADFRDDSVYIHAKSCEKVIILTTKKNFQLFFDQKLADVVKKVYAYRFDDIVRYLRYNKIKEIIISNGDVYIFYNPEGYVKKEVACFVTLYSTYLAVKEVLPELIA